MNRALMWATEPSHQHFAVQRHRGDGGAQPHAQRAAAAVFPPFLGERRCRKAR